MLHLPKIVTSVSTSCLWKVREKNYIRGKSEGTTFSQGPFDRAITAFNATDSNMRVFARQKIKLNTIRYNIVASGNKDNSQTL